MSWIQKILPRTQTSHKGNVPEGIWTKCGSCQAVLYKSELEKLQEVCPKCDHHMRITARRRIDAFLDDGDRLEGAQPFSVRGDASDANRDQLWTWFFSSELFEVSDTTGAATPGASA